MEFKIDLVLSNGYIYGKAKNFNENNNFNISTNPLTELHILDYAIKKSVDEIDSIKEKEPKLADYFLAQKYMILDPMLYDKTKSLIESGISAKLALKKAMDDFISNLDKSTSSYLKERTVDLEDVVEIVIHNMDYSYDNKLNDKYILVVDKVRPSFLISNHDNILGIIAKKGGFTSHSAILARSWNIPYVIVSDYDIKDSDTVIIDTRRNIIILNPSKGQLDNCEAEMKELANYTKKAIPHDGFLFLANISSNKDIERVLEYGFDEVGLYRTEFIFMNSIRPYSFEEQYKIYLDAATQLKDKKITFRTFDIGDDKQIPYLKASSKGILNYINNKEIFETQVKALLKANIYNNIRIMFPMIETEEEFIYLRDIVISIAKENNYNIPKIGMMLETKKALEKVETFVEPDFISIGTNDLTHELYNIKRDDNDNLVFKYIDDLLESLARVVKFCSNKGISLSICGELASIKSIGIRFYQIGIKNLSVSPASMIMLNMAYSEYINKK